MTNKKKNTNIIKYLSKNYWALSTIILAILLIMTLSTSGSPTISSEEAGLKVLSFANGQGANAELISTGDAGALYEIVLSIQGQELPVYATKDGASFTTNLIPLTARATDQTQTPTQTQETQTPSAYSEEDLVKLKTFNDCLGSKGLIIYGANWCGWTKKLVVETLGGFENAASAYVECTEEEALCSEEKVTGYPTVKLNGETYQGARTVEALATATGCPAPELTGNKATTATSASETQTAGNC